VSTTLLPQRAADDRPEREADADDRAPRADRPRAFARLGEDVGDDRHRHRVEHRAADALQGARGDQPAERRGEAAQQRAGDEHEQPDLERAPAPEAVGGRAGQQQQAGDHDHVRVDRPLQPRQRRMQVAFDRRQRDVDDRVVHRDDQQAHAADREDQRAPAFAELGCTVHSD
jgi:hypothetical protein